MAAIPRALFVIALVIVLGQLASAQPAQPAPDDRANAAEAARLYDEGKRHFDIGEYAQAIASWKQAYLRSSAPLLLFNIAQAYRLSNNCAQANRFYLNYRTSEKHPENQAELEKAMAKCAGIEPATGDAAPGEPATVPTGATATPPASPPTTTTPGPAPAPRDPAASPPSNRGGGWRIAGLATVGVGAAVLVAGGVYAGMAKHDSDVIASAQVGTPYTGGIVSTDHRGPTAASRAQALFGIGAALAVTGGALWYVGHRQDRAQVDVAITPGHTEVVLSCVF